VLIVQVLIQMSHVQLRLFGCRVGRIQCIIRCGIIKGLELPRTPLIAHRRKDIQIKSIDTITNTS